MRNILKINKTIAEFMGYKFRKNMPTNRNGFQTDEAVGTALFLTEGVDELKAVAKLKYHESWDWLMPVVEKVSFKLRERDSLPFNCSYCVWFTGDIHVSNDIKGVHKEVIKLIEWCNSTV